MRKRVDQLMGKQAADQCLCCHYIVQSLFFLNLKFQASSGLLWPYSPVCHPEDRFSGEARLELDIASISYEPRHEKTNILHMRKQRRRSASR